MTALTADRNTPRFEGDLRVGAAAAVKIFAGSLVMRDAAGYITKGQTALGLRGVGRAEEFVDNSAGSAGDQVIKYRGGAFRFANSGSTDEITRAEIGKFCYAVDDQTVAKTSGANTRSVAGVVAGVDSLGVVVCFDEDGLAAYLANRRVFVPLRVATLVGTGVYRTLAPVVGRVVKVWSITEGVLTTGDATLTAKINGAAITGGVITIAQSGSAAGDKDSATPTAANVTAVGDELSLTVGGSNATASAANAVFEIETD
ncbi:hypothetical protein [Rhodopseudomonas pseudopalustris]|uniref:Uncharacterized protein n=1 Tax=Rhodopseudomonas pseudopalustris TaxID=1513892 RepID=A0A1H8V921_9BRAD|nr:hypothetical protein [Rhodopseudomonas pseudopalustris]SEP11831.1 hypothetical protein SAMN05444123_108130 [Rhodopseudomonas pseudopalustris]